VNSGYFYSPYIPLEDEPRPRTRLLVTIEETDEVDFEPSPWNDPEEIPPDGPSDIDYPYHPCPPEDEPLIVVNWNKEGF